MSTVEETLHYNNVFESYREDINNLKKILKAIEVRHEQVVNDLAQKSLESNDRQALKVIWVSSEALIVEIKEAISRMEVMMSDFLKVVQRRIGEGYKYPWDVTEEDIRADLESTISGKE